AQSGDHSDTCLACPRRHQQRGRTTIEQTLLALGPEAAEPLRDRAHAYAGGLGRRHKRPTLTLDPLDRQATAVPTGPRVSVQLHPDHPPWSWWLGSSSLQGGPDGTTLSGTTASGRVSLTPPRDPEPLSAHPRR